MIFDNDGRALAPVHVCWNDTEAEVVIALLRSNGIDAIANSEVPHSVLPLIADGLGAVSVLVSEDDAERSRDIIRDSEIDNRTPGDETNPSPA